MQKSRVKNTIFSYFLYVIFAFFIVFVWFLSLNNVIFANEMQDYFVDKIEFSSSAKSAIVIDANTKRVFYEKNIDQKLPMASTTKIVTAITVLENCDDIDKTVKVDKNAVGVYGTSIYLKEGEELTIRELLYGLMLRSGNDAAVALSYAVAGGEKEFVLMMNELAKKVGASNSHFQNPHGLDDKDHYTTARDLALITSYALENDDFLQIVKTKHKTICEGKENQRYLLNKNKLLSRLDGCIGVKTGFTNNAGRCLVSACEKDGLRLVSVVLNCGPMFEESKTMLEMCYEKFDMLEILPPYFYVKSVNVTGGEKEFVGLYAQKGFSLPLSKREQTFLNVEFDVPNSLEAPIDKNSEVGTVKIYFDNHLIFSEKIYTIEKVDSRLLKDKIKDILKDWNA